MIVFSVAVVQIISHENQYKLNTIHPTCFLDKQEHCCIIWQTFMIPFKVKIKEIKNSKQLSLKFKLSLKLL